MSDVVRIWAGLFGSEHNRGREEATATAKFALVVGTYALLPNRELSVLYGLNPRHVWIVVVFAAGVSFLGYLLSRLLGPAMGVGITGFVGGCIASTPTVVSMADKAKRHPEIESLYTMGAILACITMTIKIFVIVSLLSSSIARSMLVPTLGMLFVNVVIGLLSWRQFRPTAVPSTGLNEQFRLKPAFLFSAFVALVLIGVELIDFTAPAIYVGAGAVSAILVNLVFKTGISWAGGTGYMTRMLTGLLVLNAVVGLGLTIIGQAMRLQMAQIITDDFGIGGVGQKEESRS
jgi:uncharacterized membrane protein (DUF4010 family)